MTLPDLNPIAVFVHVVEQKGMRAAADALGMAPSSVSRAVTALEARLGVRLIERSARSFRVTDEGLGYYAQCRAALDGLTAADATLRHRRDELAGTLRVSAPVILGAYLMDDVVPTFLMRHPRAAVFLDVTDRRVDLVPEGIDLAIRLGPLPARSALVTRLLAQPAAGLYASAAYLQKHGVPGTPEDLGGHRILALGPPGRPARWTLRRGDDVLEQAIAPVLQTNDIPTLLAAAMKGCGICLVPHFVCRQERLPERLLHVLPQWDHAPVDVRALFPSREGVTPLLRAFVDLLAERAPQALDPLRTTSAA